MRVVDVPAFVGTMQNAIIAALADEGITARDRCADGPAFTGVWVDDRHKIASIGIHRSHGVTKHGFAVNVDNDLQPFEFVIACRLPEVQMTSITRETRVGNHLPAFRERMAARFAAAFGVQPRAVGAAELEAALAGTTH
jgi:lipoyl(octanoyl) transferase